MPFGTLDTQYIDFPPGIDPAYLQNLQTEAGLDFTTIIAELDRILGAANAGADPLVAALSTVTDKASSINSAPTNMKARKHSEYTPPRPQKNNNSGVMLPISGWDLSLQFTEDGLAKMTLDSIVQNVVGAVNGMKYTQKLEALNRLFSIAEVPIDDNTVTTSPGFAGSGTGNNVFSQPFPTGVALPGGYTHYSRVTNDLAGLQSGAKTALTTLKKWHQGPFDMVAGQTMTDLIASDTTNFVDAGSALIRAGANQAEAQVDTNLYIGVYMKEIRVRKALAETDDPNIAIFKSYGAFDARNPLALRFDPKFGRNMVAKYRAFYPLDMAILLQKYGFGVNDRTAAYLLRLAGAGGYTDPVFA